MKKQKQAFTLVELIVVIVILAILGTIAFISLQGYSASSRDSVRISDVSTLKTALGVYHVGSGKYPLPDGGEEVSYSGEILRYQGTIGETVIKNLSRSMTKIPTDPSTSMEYLYSVTSDKNSYEILNLLEGDIVYQKDYTANAINQTRIPKILGTYNGLYVKTTNLIFPTPSIINSQPIIQGAGLVLDTNNIKSQVIDGGENIPNVGGKISTKTGALNINLSVYIGTINKESTDLEKINAIKAIQGAYSGSALASIGIFKNLLEKTTGSEFVSFVDGIILNNYNSNNNDIDNLPCGDIDSGNSKDFWDTQIVSIGQNCDSHKRVFICDNGVWKYNGNIADTDTYSYESCDVEPDTYSPVGGSFSVPANVGTTNVTLSIICPIDNEGSIPIEMYISGSGLYSGGNIWEQCNTSKNIVLTSSDGVKSISIKWRDKELNETAVVSKNITYTSSASTCAGTRITWSSSITSIPSGKWVYFKTNTSGVSQFALKTKSSITYNFAQGGTKHNYDVDSIMISKDNGITWSAFNTTTHPSCVVKNNYISQRGNGYNYIAVSGSTLGQPDIWTDHIQSHITSSCYPYGGSIVYYCY